MLGGASFAWSAREGAMLLEVKVEVQHPWLRLIPLALPHLFAPVTRCKVEAAHAHNLQQAVPTLKTPPADVQLVAGHRLAAMQLQFVLQRHG